MDPNREQQKTADPYQDLTTTFAQLAYNKDAEAWRVARTLRRCTDAEAVLKAATYHREQVKAWLAYHLPGDDVVASLKQYTLPHKDKLLVELRGLVEALDRANHGNRKNFEEDKGSSHIGAKGYQGSLAEQVEVRIGTAVLALQAFLKEHGEHFSVVTIEGHSILGYLNAVLEDQSANTCNNDVANRISIALESDFPEVPAPIEVGLRLLQVGFFGADIDQSQFKAPSEKMLEVAAMALGESVAELAAGNHVALVTGSFLTAVEHLDDLISGGLVTGTAIKGKLKNLGVLVGKLVAQEEVDEQAWGAAAKAAGQIKFWVNVDTSDDESS